MKRIYAVKVGRAPGIYNKKSDAMAQVNGFYKSEWRSFPVSEIQAAKRYLNHSRFMRPIVPYGYLPLPFSQNI